jgi:hypothetical protein
MYDRMGELSIENHHRDSVMGQWIMKTAMCRDFPGADVAMTRKTMAGLWPLAVAALSSSCVSADKAPLSVPSPIPITATIVSVTKSASDQLGFDFYLARPEQKLFQQQLAAGVKWGTRDLPAPIRTESLEIHTPDRRWKGTCRSVLLPHRCDYFPLSNPGLEARPTTTVLLDAVFADGARGAASIEVPNPSALDAPRILEPATAPPQGQTLRLKFTDVGADVYEVRVSLCHKYANDGINPCLDGRAYWLERRGGSSAGGTAPGDMVAHHHDGGEAEGTTTKDLRVRLTEGAVVFESALPLLYPTSVGYHVVAKRRSQGAGGVQLFTESDASCSFPSGQAVSR